MFFIIKCSNGAYIESCENGKEGVMKFSTEKEADFYISVLKQSLSGLEFEVVRSD